MPSELGMQMMNALNAVRDLHEDSSRLLIDLDSWMDKQKFVRFGPDDTSASGHSADVKNHRYMSNFLYRRWRTEADSQLLRAVNIVFFDDGDRFEEPMIFAAELRYATDIPANLSRKDAWTAWSTGPRSIGNVQKLTSGDLDGRLERGTVLAELLSSINASDKAGELFERLGASTSSHSLAKP